MKKRRLEIKENEKESKGLRSSSGNRFCRYCKKEVYPPKRTFCSDPCVHEWRIRSNNKYMRETLYERDLGICELCLTDTRYQKIELENISRKAKKEDGDQYLTNVFFVNILQLLRITMKESKKSLWHADHRIPVFDGGGQSGLDNLRTLCIKCHKTVTKEQRKNVKK